MEKTVYESNVPRVYTLYRVSTIGQVEKDDIPMQKQVCRDFAEKQGWVIVKEFSEKGVSGYGVTKLDGIVEKVIRMKFTEIAAAPESEILNHQHKKKSSLQESSSIRPMRIWQRSRKTSQIIKRKH